MYKMNTKRLIIKLFMLFGCVSIVTPKTGIVFSSLIKLSFLIAIYEQISKTFCYIHFTFHNRSIAQ